MILLFLLGSAYCIFRAVRHFLNKRPPMYVEKDPNINSGQVRAWNHEMGYSMIFWAGFAVIMASYLYFEAWPILIPMGLVAAGGVYFSMKGSAILRDKSGKYKPEERKPGRGVARKKKTRKK